VYQREGFRKPNQFGYGPDGYRMQIVSAAKPGYGPTLSASSPCFSAAVAQEGIPFPIKLPAD
jgi:hypothetical protein